MCHRLRDQKNGRLVQYHTGPILAPSTAAEQTHTGGCTVEVVELANTDISGTQTAHN